MWTENWSDVLFISLITISSLIVITKTHHQILNIHQEKHRESSFSTNVQLCNGLQNGIYWCLVTFTTQLNYRRLQIKDITKMVNKLNHLQTPIPGLQFVVPGLKLNSNVTSLTLYALYHHPFKMKTFLFGTL